MNASEEDDWQRRYDASLAERDRERQEQGFGSLPGISGRQVTGFIGGGVVGVYALLTSDNPWLIGLGATTLGVLVVAGVVLGVKASTR